MRGLIRGEIAELRRMNRVLTERLSKVENSLTINRYIPKKNNAVEVKVGFVIETMAKVIGRAHGIGTYNSASIEVERTALMPYIGKSMKVVITYEEEKEEIPKA